MNSEIEPYKIIILPFKNKDIRKALELASVIPDEIRIEKNNPNNFCFLYAFSNLNDSNYKLMTLTLVLDFVDIVCFELPTYEEFNKNYSIVLSREKINEIL